jgi:hypothetical protein
VEIHPGVHTKRFLHQFNVANRGWIPAMMETISLAINTHIPSLQVELVTLQYAGHKDYQRCTIDVAPGTVLRRRNVTQLRHRTLCSTFLKNY